MAEIWPSFVPAGCSSTINFYLKEFFDNNINDNNSAVNDNDDNNIIAIGIYRDTG